MHIENHLYVCLNDLKGKVDTIINNVYNQFTSKRKEIEYGGDARKSISKDYSNIP